MRKARFTRGVFHVCPLAVSFALSAATLYGSDAIDLAERDDRGGAAYIIVIPKKATAVESYAAEELQRCLRMSTGVDLPIMDDDFALPRKCILVGGTRWSPAAADAASIPQGGDGFRLRARGTRLAIVSGGGDDRGGGVLYGVYELLERFGGCRWFDSSFEVIPKLARFLIPNSLDVVQSPSFALRQVAWHDYIANPQFAARNRIALADMDAKYGGGRHRFSDRLGYCHTFATLLPPSEYAADHPEYFAEIGGRRRSTPHAQPCLSNGQVLKIVTDRVLDEVARSYSSGIRHYGVSQNDNLSYCRCWECRRLDDAEGSPSASLLRFVNSVADAVAAHYPDVTIQTLAYTYSRTPPRTIRPRKNVKICYCTLECDFAHALETSECPVNRRALGDIEAWSAISQNLGIWDYTTDFNAALLVWPSVRAMARNISRYDKFGVQDVFLLGNYQGPLGDFSALKGWLAAKLLWNANADVEALLDDFFRGYYGDAAPLMREYFNRVESAVENDARHHLSCMAWVNRNWIGDDLLVELDHLLSQAEKRVKSTRHAKNVACQRLCVDFTRLMRYLLASDGLAAYNLTPRERRDETLHRSMHAAALRLDAALHDESLAGFRLSERSDDFFRQRLDAFLSSFAKPSP